jgi:hypothetical protein
MQLTVARETAISSAICWPVWRCRRNASIAAHVASGVRPGDESGREERSRNPGGSTVGRITYCRTAQATKAAIATTAMSNRLIASATSSFLRGMDASLSHRLLWADLAHADIGQWLNMAASALTPQRATERLYNHRPSTKGRRTGAMAALAKSWHRET